jgi:hypothetical protein
MLSAKPCAVVALAVVFVGVVGFARAQDALPLVTEVESQPLLAQAQRVAQALGFLGQPLTTDQAAALEAASRETDSAAAVKAIQRVLDPLCLVGVNINPESRVKVAPGAAAKTLVEQGWQVFLVTVQNDAGVTAPLRVSSPNAAPLYKQSTGRPDPDLAVQPQDVPQRWMDVEMFSGRPLLPNLSGLALEYRVIQIYSRDRGQREATLAFDVGQGTQDLGFRNERRCCSTAGRRRRSSWRSTTSTARPRPGSLSFAMPMAAFIPPGPEGWNRTSSFTTRSIAIMANRSRSHPGPMKSPTRAAPSIA